MSIESRSKHNESDALGIALAQTVNLCRITASHTRELRGEAKRLRENAIRTRKELAEIHGQTVVLCHLAFEIWSATVEKEQDSRTGEESKRLHKNRSLPNFMLQRHVLLVEDDDDIRSLYGFFLGSAGFKVKAVSNGLEALSELQEQIADVIVTDIAMPVLDGIELIKIIKNRIDLANIPIIAVTSFGQNLQERAIAAGADKVARKPTDSRTMLDLIDSVLTQPQTLIG